MCTSFQKYGDGERIITKLRNLPRNLLHLQLLILAGNWKIQISEMDALQWLKSISDEFLVSIVLNLFKGSRHYYDDGFDCS